MDKAKDVVGVLKGRLERWPEVLAVIAVTLAIALSSPPVAQALMPGTSVRGMVTDAVSHQPISNAIISGGPAGEGASDLLGTTDSTGHYEIALPAGSYDITCYMSSRYSQATALGVNANPTNPAVRDFALVPYAKAFYGTVKDKATGKALASASVHCESANPGSPFSAWAYPDAAGHYEVYAPAGTYDLTFASLGYGAVTASAVVFGGTPAVLRDCELQPLGRAVYGTVTDATTLKPLAGASVVLSWTDAGGERESWASTGSDGAYEFRVAAGLYRVRAAAWPYRGSPTVDVVCDGVAPVRKDFALQPSPRASIQGTVSDELTGRPLAGVGLRITGTTAGGAYGASVTADGSGRYTITLPPPGTYEITASTRGYWSVKATDLAFDGYTPLEQAFAMSASPRTFFGSVIDGKTRAPVPSAAVAAYRMDDAGVYRSHASTGTDASGLYVFHLTPGTYQLRASALGYAYRTSSGLVPDGTSSTFDDLRLEPLVPDPALLSGIDRYETSIKSSAAAFPVAGACDTVVLATGTNYPDALGAAGLAGAADCPILLVRGNTPSAALKAEISRLTKGRSSKRIYIAGGTGVVTAAMESALKASYGTSSVKRLAGATRYGTAEAVANELYRVLIAKHLPLPTKAVVVSGASFPDALLVGPIAYRQHWPILLVGPVDAAFRTTLSANKVKTVMIVGSTASVTLATESALKSVLGSANVSRPCGAIDRYAQSVAVANWATGSQGFTWGGVGVATGLAFPDALGAGPLLGSRNGVLLLTPTTSLDARVRAALVAHKTDVSGLSFFGGTGAVSQAVRNAVVAALH